MKRIIICCDGTWNTPDKDKEGIPVPTNVVKIAEAISQKPEGDIPQLTYYDPGVGTSGSWLRRAFDGATGSGLSQNILEAYRFLISNYENNDQLFFFGFSRGAFTVRSLAGLIRNSGILRPNAIDMMDRAFALYRARGVSTHPKGKEAALFRRTYAVSDVTRIKFIGVWDTVGALGNPLLLRSIPGRRYRFHDRRLSSTVEHAYHALAIDEKRPHFRATLWHQQAHTQAQSFEQVWFVGVHSNIGGGYPSTGLSDIALEWMTGKARQCGLEIDEIVTQTEQLKLERSRKGFYLLFPPWYRGIAKAAPEKGPTNESLHPSVMDYYTKVSSYRPKNLVNYFKRFPDLLQTP